MSAAPKTIVPLSLVAVTLTLGGIAAGVPQAGQLAAQKKGADLKMSIRATAPESTDSLRLHVTFENVGDKDIVLNLGMMLGNGKILLPEAVRLILTGPEDQSRELHFSDKRYGVVAGRIDDYAVPLRAGSAYTLKLSLKDFWCPKSNEFKLELKPGRYGVRAEFTGNGAKYEQGLLMHFWTGKLESEVAQFQIEKQG